MWQITYMKKPETRLTTRCELCGSTVLEHVLDLGDHPMCDDLVPTGDQRVAQKYPISIMFCDTCKTAHQAHQIPKSVLFPPTYHYRARHTADVLSGMKQLVARVEEAAGSLSGETVLDVGCNDGSLLTLFREKGAKTLGIEPTDAAADAIESGHTVRQDYFTTATAEEIVALAGQPRIVTFTNVFAHIENLNELLNALRVLMGPHTIVVIENHYLGSVLDRYQFDTFYHEHPRTYSLTSFSYVAETLGVEVLSVEFPKRYGGNIRVMLGHDRAASARTADDQTGPDEGDFCERLYDLGRRVPTWRSRKRDLINEMVDEHGPLIGKAFPGRAAILVELLDLDEGVLQRVHEKPGSMKIGHNIPGTTIPIVSDDCMDWGNHGDAPVINLAWHISHEIRGYLGKRGLTAPIVDIFNADEFDRLSP